MLAPVLAPALSPSFAGSFSSSPTSSEAPPGGGLAAAGVLALSGAALGLRGVTDGGRMGVRAGGGGDVDQRGDGRAEEERGRGRADECLAFARTAGGDRPAQVVQGAVARLHVLDGLVQQGAQLQLVRVEPFEALFVPAVVHSSVPSVRVCGVLPVRCHERAQPCEPVPLGHAPAVRGDRLRLRCGLRSVLGLRLRRGVLPRRVRGPSRSGRWPAVLVPAVAGVLAGVGRTAVRALRAARRGVRRAAGGGPRALRLAFLGARVPRVLAVDHADASMASRSAAMPREPYALTEPSEMPSVSATWASVMSAK